MSAFCKCLCDRFFCLVFNTIMATVPDHIGYFNREDLSALMEAYGIECPDAIYSSSNINKMESAPKFKRNIVIFHFQWIPENNVDYQSFFPEHQSRLLLLQLRLEYYFRYIWKLTVTVHE